jgi:hypothetical protein
MALDATVGGANANSYLTVTEATAYFATRLYSSVWTAASNGDKEAALIWATRLIDAKIKPEWDQKEFPQDATIRRISTITADGQCFICWNGAATDNVQALAWPRTGMKNKNGYDILSNVIPQQLKDVTCELALLLLTGDRTAENEIDVLGLTGIKAGPVELSFKNTIEQAKILPIAVIDLLVPSWYFVFMLDPSATRTLFKVL